MPAQIGKLHQSSNNALYKLGIPPVHQRCRQTLRKIVVRCHDRIISSIREVPDLQGFVGEAFHSPPSNRPTALEVSPQDLPPHDWHGRVMLALCSRGLRLKDVMSIEPFKSCESPLIHEVVKGRSSCRRPRSKLEVR